MSRKLQIAVKTILAGAAISLLSQSALAANAVGPKAISNWSGSDNVLEANSSITTVTTGINKNSWTDNNSSTVASGAILANSAWAHTGNWWTFDVANAGQTVDIKASLLSGNANIAFTVWASGASAFNGGTAAPSEIGSITGNNAPHDMNQVGQLGDAGTVWATDSSINAAGGGNLLSTLAYVNGGVAHTNAALNDFGQVINAGVNQVDNTGTYFSGAVAGYVSNSAVDLQFHNLAAGWYTIFIGGANTANSAASTYQLSIAAVPVPSAVYLFGSALAGLMVSGRRKLKLA